MFNKFLFLFFNALHSFFIFIKNGKQNTVHFSLFIFMKELKKELLKNIKINFMVIFTSIVCTLFKSKFVSSPCPWWFSDVQWYTKNTDTKNPLFGKQLMYFNVYITGCYFHICFILLFKKSFIYSFKIVKVDLKFKQKLWKINVKDFMLSSVGRTIQIIWNTFSRSNKLFPLRWTYLR